MTNQEKYPPGTSVYLGKDAKGVTFTGGRIEGRIVAEEGAEASFNGVSLPDVPAQKPFNKKSIGWRKSLDKE